ncbi:ammonium transporter [Picosynechococcus sp. PCC 73109]|uniref:ammonium transporter n=1 Tax=Picosynechococcus sp. PCC 73109 TaxID=374982 RepID=UPI0007458813|nr:ammonium transporter [Picosynechococcus sp. PCC 73109]AMA10568.1 ammonium transporter [Picosynechococcus sp. PCC 73109]
MRSPHTTDNSVVLRLARQLSRHFSPAWLACIPLAAIITVVWGTAAMAQSDVAIDQAGQVQIILDTIFLLIASVLVIFMNAGFGMLEAGFCRQKNAVNILSKNLIVFAVATIAYWAIGYAFMYGEGTSFIGLKGFFFNGSSIPYTGEEWYIEEAIDGETVQVLQFVPESVSFLFQVAFAATAATIVSGAVAERIKFDAFLIFSFLLVAVSYPITGHWQWDGAWLYEFGFHDFAGSTIVHSVGGWAALVGAAVVGPRLGKYRDGQVHAIPGHNMSIATLGCLILWIGWFGFNPGSQLAADAHVPYIAITTNLSAAAGGITATATSWVKDGKPDLSMIINGILAGLVGITAGCDGVSFLSAVIIGAISGVLVVFSVAFFDAIKIDDPVGATSVHLVCGIWGTLAVGLFTQETGLFTGGGIQQLIAQIVGILSIGGFTVAFSFIVWYALSAVLGGIRVEKDEELRGLDIGEHGMEAYSGFVKESDVIFRGTATGSETEG